MKHCCFKRFFPFMVFAGILLVSACNDKWSKHYDEESFLLPDKSLYTTISEMPELSYFSEMLKKAGYDKVLDASQSFTVWAPNNDALQGVDTSDAELVREIVKNHITRSRVTTSGFDTKIVSVLNGKYIYFRNEGGWFSFAGNEVQETNIPSRNGLLHVIKGYAPYFSNLWEYIGQTPDLDSLAAYIYGESKSVFDPPNSIELGVNSSGQVIYDSAFIVSNKVLEELAAIDLEDSIYSVIMPTTSAWNEAYGKIEGYYNFPADGGGVIRQRELTQWTLVQDLFFRGYVNPKPEMEQLVTTNGTVITSPATLFENTERDSLSNGLAYITEQFPFNATDSWFKEVRVEAEEPDGRYNAKNIIFLRNSFGSNLNVSNDRYILVDPTSVGSSVEFEIPNILSAKYNIYCVFVPASIVDPSNMTPTKVSFVLTYIRRASGSTFVKRVTPDINTTFPLGVTKMFVDQFDFEYANVIDEDYGRVAVKLEVINDVTTEEEQSGDFSRTMRIDCIIFEPVSE